MKLQVETRQKALVTRNQVGPIAITPPIGEDFWLWRVRLSDNQAIVAFPKFFTIGCGFQKEEDWNTNLPLTCKPEEIYEHIKHNKANRRITKKNCIAAIRLLQETAIAAGGIKREKLDL